jgi:hypothetical protein
MLGLACLESLIDYDHGPAGSYAGLTPEFRNQVLARLRGGFDDKEKRAGPQAGPSSGGLGDLPEIVIGTVRLPHGLDVTVQLLKLCLLGVHHVIRRGLQLRLVCEKLVPEPQVRVLDLI